jgi:Fur family transcriptional regulator, stress-responsive regulator
LNDSILEGRQIVDHWVGQLRAAGLRVTQARLAVLEVLDERPHADVEAIAVGARNRLGSLSTQAVYDVVHALTGVGLLRRIEPAGSRALFELDTGDNHHHVVCRSCGVVADIRCATGQSPCLESGHDTGFVVDEAELIFWGVCLDCQIRNNSTEWSSA